MINKFISSCCLLLGVLFALSCKPQAPVSAGADEPELTLYSLALNVVDAETREIVPKISEVNFVVSEAAESHTSLATKASRRIVASKEGIVLASWIGPMGGSEGITIEAEGYETMTVAPENDGHLGSNKNSFTLKQSLRTVKMKKIQSEEEKEAEEAEAEEAEEEEE